MILNLACFKAFCSSSGVFFSASAVETFVLPEFRSNATAADLRRRPARRRLAALKRYFYHNYIYKDSCFSFPFIRFAVVPCSNVSVFLLFFSAFQWEGCFHDCYPLILGFFLASFFVCN